MLRILSAKAVRSVKFAPQVRAVTPVVSRSFFWGKTEEKDLEIKSKIMTDKEQQTGRRKEELDAAEEGYDKFNNSSIVPPSDAGSWENPIEVKSRLHLRRIFFASSPPLLK